MTEAWVYVHPAMGVLACLSLVWVGFTGLRSRQKRDDAAASRTRHRVWAPRVYALVGGVVVGGPASVALLRDDRTVMDSAHFWVGMGIFGLLTANWATSRFGKGRPSAWAAHAWIGMGAMLCAIWAFMLGLELLP